MISYYITRIRTWIRLFLSFFIYIKNALVIVLPVFVQQTKDRTKKTTIHSKWKMSEMMLATVWCNAIIIQEHGNMTAGRWTKILQCNFQWLHHRSEFALFRENKIHRLNTKDDTTPELRREKTANFNVIFAIKNAITAIALCELWGKYTLTERRACLNLIRILFELEEL